ncbi:hypothetical protein CHRYSEOSP005_11780 [Chryseobacterium sp. Alg-005]|uniref:hypothetical protein n=1 Tax=Chryseobacterium sp. Alg-005 TaxID=3159516 RepID=UPI00355583F1
MKTFKGHPRVRGFSKDDNDSRYKIHRKIRYRNIDCKIFAKRRTIIIPIEMTELHPLLLELIKDYGHKIQTEAFIKETI